MCKKLVRFGKIESRKNWKSEKLKVGKIESRQNWKSVKLTVGEFDLFVQISIELLGGKT